MNRENYFSKLEIKLAEIRKLLRDREELVKQESKELIEDYVGPLYIQTIN